MAEEGVEVVKDEAMEGDEDIDLMDTSSWAGSDRDYTYDEVMREGKKFDTETFNHYAHNHKLSGIYVIGCACIPTVKKHALISEGVLIFECFVQ